MNVLISALLLFVSLGGLAVGLYFRLPATCALAGFCAGIWLINLIHDAIPTRASGRQR